MSSFGRTRAANARRPPIFSKASGAAQFIGGYGQKGFPLYGFPPVRFTRINGMPGFATIEPEGLPQIMSLEIEDGKITAIYAMRNPTS